MNPLRLDIPDEIVTERLIIRVPRPGDGAAVYRAVLESLENLRRFPESMGWALAEPSVEDSELFCRQSHADFLARRDFPLTLWLREAPVVVGGGGLHRPDWSVPKFEIGWWGYTAYLGRGLITEAARAILDFAFTSLGARRVEARPDDLNTRSIAVCERSGMTLEGVMRHERLGRDGEPRNTRLYAAVR